MSKFASPKGRCHSFGKDADGYIPGEGVGAVLLKPLGDAQTDQDYIYGVIKGTSVNHGGKTNGYTVPNPKAQAELIIDAFEKTKINQEQIGYIEAHGAGTPLGDPIEIDGLTKAFEKYTTKKQFCSIGSVKSNIGHLEATSGLAGLTKVLLQFKYKTLVPTLHIEETNPDIDFSQTPFYLQKTISPWEAVKKICDDGKTIELPRIAGISAFGAGGSNGHVIVEEYQNELPIGRKNPEDCLVLFSAKDDISLKRTIDKFRCFLKNTLSTNNKGFDKVKEDVFQIISQLFGVPEDMLNVENYLNEYGIDFFNYYQINQKLKELGYQCLDDKVDPDSITISDLVRTLCTSNVCGYEPDNSLYTLENISYTLQVAREPMRQRLAMIVSSKHDLIDKLDKWFNNQEDEGIYSSLIIKQKNSMIDSLDENDVIRMLEQRNLDLLAEAWVSKKEIDWHKLKRNGLVLRVPIPGYAFSDEKYWIKQNEENNVSRLHPLVGQNESTFERSLFSTEFTGKEFFLNDHVLMKSKVLPGMAYLEMARFAASYACNKQVSRIRNMIWNSIFKMDHEPKKLYAELKKDEKWINCEIFSNENDNVILHGKCRIITDDVIEPLDTVNIEKIKLACSKIANGDELYRFYKMGGLEYGPSFKMVKEVCYNENEALALLSLPMSLYNDFDQFVFHPSMLDAAFQGGLCLNTFDENNTNKTHIPFFLEEVTVYDKLEKECYSHITIVNGADGHEQADINIRKLNCSIISKKGKILVELKAFTARAVQLNSQEDGTDACEKNEVITQNETAVNNIHCYHPVWGKKDIDSAIDLSNKSEILLVFDHSHDLYNEVKKKSSNSVIFVQPGNEYSKLDREGYKINARLKSDYSHMFEDMKKNGIIPSYVLIQWLASENIVDQIFGENENYQRIIEHIYERSAFTLLNFVQSWNEVFAKIDVNIIFCKPLNQGIERAFTALVLGFAYSLQINMPNIKVKVLENSCTNNTENLLKEIYYQDGSKEIKITDNGRFVRGFKKSLFKLSDDLNFKTGGTYLITGGMGGIGKIISDYLVKKYKAKLIILGRSSLNESNKKFIIGLKKLSEKVVYYPCDITSSVQMEKVALDWHREVGDINGVIHIAGMMSQKDILNKTKEEFAKILEPKVKGTLILDKIIENENLDFFIAFSSTSSMLGDYGRCDYSAANNFIDEFINFRENQRKKGLVTGKSYVVNWPIWKEGGMHVGNTEMESQMLKASGLSYLETQDALRCLETVLGQDECQTIILSGEEKRIASLFTSVNTSNNDTAEKSVQELKNNLTTVYSNSTELTTNIESDIKQMVAEMHQIDVHRINSQENLDAYGFNSVTITELCGIINTRFNLDLNPTIFFEYPTIEKISKYIHNILNSKKTEQISLTGNDFIDNLEFNNVSKNLYLLDKKVINSKEDLYDYFQQCNQTYMDNSFNLSKTEELYDGYKSLHNSKKTLLHMLVELNKEQKVEVLTIGKGPVLLILPGFAVSFVSIINQIGFLSKYFQLVIIHLPGSGLSDGIPDLLYPPSLSKMILDVLNALSIDEKISVMSFSFGGLVAQTLVKTNPERFNLLVLGCSFTKNDSAVTSEESLEEKFLKDFEVTNTKDDYYEYYLMSKSINNSAIRFLPKASLVKHSIVDELSKISVPTLIISGELDAVIDKNESVIIAERIPKSIHIRFTKGGHCVHLTNSKSFNRIVKIFIENRGYVKSKLIEDLRISDIEICNNYSE